MAQRKALLIAVPEYNDDAIESFADVVRHDLNGLEQSLRSSGYAPITIRGLDSLWEVTRTQILDQLGRFLESASEGDTLLIYLSGHGIHFDGNDYLLPADSVIRDSANFEEYFVKIDFSHLVEKSKAETVIIFIDACRQGVKLKSKSTYAVGWGSSDRAKVKKQCFLIVFACSPGEYAQYVTGTDPASLFTKALTEILHHENPARTVHEVLTACHDRLAELVQEHEKQPQNIRFSSESEVNDQKIFSRNICDNLESAPPSLGVLNPWALAATSSEIWDVEHLADDTALSMLKDATCKIVTECWNQREKTVSEFPDNCWHDDNLPIRVLNNISLLLHRSDPHIELSAGECALIILSPFVREAVILAGMLRMASADPFSLEITGSTESGLRSELETTYKSHPQLVRKANRLKSQDKYDSYNALVTWMIYRSVLRHPQLWFSIPEGSFPLELELTIQKYEKDSSSVVAETLTLGRIKELARCIFGDPERVERTDRPNSLCYELYLGGQAKQRQVREKLIAYLLVLSGRLAIDPRQLQDLLVDHLGLSDPITSDLVLETLQAVRWISGGRSLNMHVECSHPAVDLALRGHARDSSQVLETILTKSDTNHPTLKFLNGLPIRLTADEIYPANDLSGNPVYQTPHIRFHLAQDEVRELLMGTQLYGDPTLAIRELYQNALDACRYRRARLQYLDASNQKHLNSPEWKGQILFNQGYDEEGRAFLECIDNGIGMGIRELSECFARAGRRFHDTPEFIEEQTEWRKYGIELYPNSQFGVGVFSYFMLADEIEITTCRLDQRGIPGKQLKARVSGTGTLFRVVEENSIHTDSGTCIRLYLNKTTYKDKYKSHESISCMNTLKKLLWVAEYETIVNEGAEIFTWEPSVLYHPEYNSSQYLKGSSDFLWWVTKKGGGQISRYDKIGAILSDGIYTEPENTEDIPLTFIVNLTESHRPNLSIDRKKIMNWDKLWVMKLLQESWKTLLEWPRLTLSWIWLLYNECTVTTEKLTSALLVDNRMIEVGYVGWNIRHYRYSSRSRELGKSIELIDQEWVNQKICISEVGCFYSDIGLFFLAYKKILRNLSSKEQYLSLFEKEKHYKDIWDCPEWLKSERFKIWNNIIRAKSTSELGQAMSYLGNKYDDGLPIVCPTLFPKDEKILEEYPGVVSPWMLVSFASKTKETISELIARLNRLSPLGFTVSDLNLKEVGKITVSKNELNAVSCDGKITVTGVLNVAARTKKNIVGVIESLEKFKMLGIQLPEFDFTAVGNMTIDKLDLLLINDEGEVDCLSLLKAMAYSGKPVRFFIDRISKLLQLGISIPKIDFANVADLRISRNEFDLINNSEIEPFDIIRLSAMQDETVGKILRRLQKLITFGIQIPSVNPNQFSDCKVSKKEVQTFKRSKKVSIYRVLYVAAVLQEPIKVTVSRWQRFRSLGLDVDKINISRIPEHIVISIDDLKVFTPEETITVKSILSAAIGLNETLYDSLKRTQKFEKIGIKVPKLKISENKEFKFNEKDIHLFNDSGQIDVVSMLKASSMNSELVSETYERSARFKNIGIYVPELSTDKLEGLKLSREQTSIISADGRIERIGVLWLAAISSGSVCTVLKQIKKISKLGIKIPQIPMNRNKENHLDISDLKALAALIILNDKRSEIKDRDHIRIRLRRIQNAIELDGFSILKNVYEDNNVQSFRDMFTKIKLVSEILFESETITRSRLKKFELILLK